MLSDDKVRISQIAFERYEALYEAELYREKERPMWGSEHEQAARRRVYEAIIAECSAPAGSAQKRAGGTVEGETSPAAALSAERIKPLDEIAEDLDDIAQLDPLNRRDLIHKKAEQIRAFARSASGAKS